MTNKILLLKKIACAAGIVLLMAGSVQADEVFSTDFNDGATAFPYNGGSGAFVLGGATPDVVAEDFFGSTNGVNLSGGDLTFSNSTQNRFRGSGVWLDTTDWATGPITVAVDVANFVAGADTELIFQAYAATGVDASNTVSFDLHGAVSNGASPVATGTATIAALGDEQTITANGTAVPFTFDYNGTDEFVALTFVQSNAVGGTAFGSADLDNLTVNDSATSVPEPSSLSLVAVGLGLIGVRRRRLK